jgi:hypothetical protein
MKMLIRIIIIISCQLSIVSLFAQAPHVIPYQAVARNANGNLISNQNIGLRFTIHDVSATGTVVYQERQSATTNAFGLFSVNIGTGTTSIQFSSIQWGKGAKFMQVEIDTAGGTSYTDMGTQQLMSVPFAEYANNGLPAGTAPGNVLYWDGSQWLTVTPGINGQTLCFCNGKPQWGPCTPTVLTDAVSSISFTSVVCGGNVTNDGGASVGSRGICWNTSPNPTIANSYTTSGTGTGTGTFLAIVSPLQPGTTYYLRAFATNAAGTTYGSEDTVTTLNPTVPSILTAYPSNVGFYNAWSGGSYMNNNGAAITSQGICWSTSPHPTLANDNAIDEYLNPSYFTIMMYSLQQGTTYYVRAFATNSAGTGYGNEYSFNTQGVSTPSLTTTAMSGITNTTASTGGNVSSDGGSVVSARGICYSTNANPTTANNVIAGGAGAGSFTSNLIGLTPNTTYYVRAYATNSLGTSYGNQITFTSSPYTLGQSFGGGNIFYIDGSTGQHGLIAATTDGPNSGNTYWATNGFPPLVATATGYGTGSANTTALINAIGTSCIAANCRNYTGGGFNDWFLPSKDELSLMLQNKSYIGNINNGTYWSSSQVSTSTVWACNYSGSPFQVQSFGITIYYYRPVRSF